MNWLVYVYVVCNCEFESFIKCMNILIWNVCDMVLWLNDEEKKKVSNRKEIYLIKWWCCGIYSFKEIFCVNFSFWCKS